MSMVATKRRRPEPAPNETDQPADVRSGVGRLTALAFAAVLVELSCQQKVFRVCAAPAIAPSQSGTASPNRPGQPGHDEVAASTGFYIHQCLRRALPGYADAEYGPRQPHS